MREFGRIKRLPPYVFAVVNALKAEARARGEDIVDLGMGNPDLPAPDHVIEKLCEAARNPRNHRYSVSSGIAQLKLAVAEWYLRRFGVDVDPACEVVATIGSKEGLGHLVLAVMQPGDVALTPAPAYPIHPYSVIIAGGDVRSVPIGPGIDFFTEMAKAFRSAWPRPKLLIINFPHNPTTECVDVGFFEQVVSFAKEHDLMVIHDFAYADLVFDGYRAPSFLEAPGAKDVGVEFTSLTKGYSMAGWRVGFCVGNPQMVAALARIKSYLDYGTFQPIQIASIIALRGPQECVQNHCATYAARRDVLVRGLGEAGWDIASPRATMFVWARIPEAFRAMGSLEFAKFVLREAGVAISPGIGFGEGGDEFVRFALVENEHRIRQAVRGLKALLRRG